MSQESRAFKPSELVDESLLLLGASVRAVAQSARRAGFRPCGVDLFADVDLRRIASAVAVVDYPRGLAVAARRHPPGPWMYTGGLENYPRLVDRIARRRHLLGNSGRTLTCVRNPLLVAEALNEGGVAIPAVARNAIGIPSGETWLEKPWHGSGGAGIKVYAGPDATTSEPAPATKHYYQKHVAGQPCSAVYLAADGQSVLLGVTEQLIGTSWTGATGFRYSGSLGPLRIAPELSAQFERIGEVLAAKFGLSGLFGVDAVCDDSIVWPVEVNPRWTASVEVLERGLGFSAVAWHVAACLERRLPARISMDSASWCGKAILFASEELVVSERFARYAENEWSKAGWPNLADVPAAGTTIRSERPITTVLAEADDDAGVRQLLRRRAKDVQQALGFCS